MKNGLHFFIVKNKWIVIFAVFFFFALVAVGGAKVKFTSDYRAFFKPDAPQLVAFEALQNIYTKSHNILFVVAPQDHDVFTPSILGVIAQMTEAAWQIPHSIRVDSITNFQHSYADQDDLIVEELVLDPATLEDADLTRIRGIVLNEPLLVNRLISPGGLVTGVNVTIQLPDEQFDVIPKIVAQARAIQKTIRQDNPGIEVFLTGTVMLDHAFGEASAKDMTILMPIMLAVVVILLWWFFRSLTATLATTAVILLAIAATIGIAGWFGIKITTPSSAAPTIVLTLAVANCVHLLVNFFAGLSAGLSRPDAIGESLRLNLHPISLANFTSIIGFLSLNFSESPPFHDLGNIVACGIALTFLASVTVLPALLLVLPVTAPHHRPARTAIMEAFSKFVVRRKTPLLWSMTAATLVLILCLPLNELNDEYVKYFDEQSEFRNATEFTTANLTGVYTIEYSLDSGHPGGISDPRFLALVDQFAAWLRVQPEVIHVNSLTEIMKRLNKNLHADEASWYKLPQDRKSAAQYLLLYEMSLPVGLDLNNIINIDKSSTRLTATLHSLSTNELLELEHRVSKWLQNNGLHSTGSGPDLMFAHIGERNIKGMLIGTALALVLISLLLIVALRSTRVGLLSLLPNLLPACMAFGLWGLMVGQINLAVSVVSGMTLGIVVDDTVHFLSKYLRARRERQLTSEQAVHYAFVNVGPALWITSLILIVGFLVLIFSSFEATAWMGLLTTLTILFALLADFLFLPPILMRFDKKNH